MKKCKMCGIEKDLSCFYLYRSQCKECKSKLDTKRHRHNRINNPIPNILKDARRRAREKNILFDITSEDIIIPDICPVLGIPLKVGERIACHNSPSLDRIRPELGYVKGNIQVISYRANTLKSNATIEELQKVLEHLRSIV